MTDVLITIDTELSAALHQKSVPAMTNARYSIFGCVDSGKFGIGWQMDCLDEYGLKGVFFVDPMPALVYGSAFLTEVVQTIVSRGHEVQLHVHTEWLEWAESSPVGGRRGSNIADFESDDQFTILMLAMDLLEEAKAPRPIAFRAGNYGADDRTLDALVRVGLTWDTSFNPAFALGSCRITLGVNCVSPVRHGGVVELPVSGLFDWPGHVRPAQVCALSAWEMCAALDHAAREHHPAFTIVTHSFEMLSRDRRRPNRVVMNRFRLMCRAIAQNSWLRSVGFAELDPAIAAVNADDRTRVGPNPIRTALRVAEQVAGTLLYERRLKPA